MNIIDPENNGSSSENVFDLEESYDKQLTPLISELCKKAEKIGIPVFIVACYKSDGTSAWLASSARSRENGFVPREFYVIRAVVEGVTVE